MTLDEAFELREGDTLEADRSTLLVLGPAYADFASPYLTSQWRLPVLNLESGKREYWPNGRFGELERC